MMFTEFFSTNLLTSGDMSCIHNMLSFQERQDKHAPTWQNLLYQDSLDVLGPAIALTLLWRDVNTSYETNILVKNQVNQLELSV
jgi:hypothetical protein